MTSINLFFPKTRHWDKEIDNYINKQTKKNLMIYLEQQPPILQALAKLIEGDNN